MDTHTNLTRARFGPEIDRRVQELGALVRQLDATIAQPVRDSRGVEALLARIDDTVAELSQATSALDGVAAWPRPIGTLTGRARSEPPSHRTPRIARPA